MACRAVCLFAAGRADEAKRFADSALRQVLPAEEQARVRYSVASMFDLSPVVRAENARAGLALPSLPAELRASLSASLYHSLSVAGYAEEALEGTREHAGPPTKHRSDIVAAVRGARSRGAVPVTRVRTSTRDRNRRGGGDHRGQEDARARLGHILRSWTLAALDRFDEALQGSTRRSSPPNRIARTGRCACSKPPEAGWPADGRPRRGRRRPGEPLHPEEAHLIAGNAARSRRGGSREAEDPSGRRDRSSEVAEIAKVMLRSDTPYVRYHAAWYLALLSPQPVRPHGGARVAQQLGFGRTSQDVPALSPRSHRRRGASAYRGGGRRRRTGRAGCLAGPTTRRAEPGRALL